MAKVSLILATARDDYSLACMPDVHIFQPTLESLEKQNFRDFELVISDCCYELRPNLFKYNSFLGKKYDFPIKHLNVKPYSQWLQKGLWAKCASQNLGIIEADPDSEFIIWLDDCCEIDDSNYIQKFLDWNKKGYFTLSFVKYYCKDQEIPDVKDSRWQFLKNNDAIQVSGREYFGYSSCSMDAIIEVNGYDENLDAEKSLGDVELGIRLSNAGFKFVMDRNIVIKEHRHDTVSQRVLTYKGSSLRQNYNLLLLKIATKETKANHRKLTEQEFEWVLKAAYVNPNIPKDVPLYEPDSEEYKLQRWWFQNQRTFNLRDIRLDKAMS